MAHPRIRDFITFLTTLPASMMIGVCLFLPHTESCQHRVETPVESGTWLAIIPLVIIGALPLVWRVVPRVRRGLPELALSFTMIVLALFAITIPVAIYLMWGYAKRSFRGETLVAMCSTTCVTLWLFFYPLITIGETWLPPAHMTWGCAVLLLAGCAVWTSAAVSRTENVRESQRLQAIFVELAH
jgi:hypothetical protein